MLPKIRTTQTFSFMFTALEQTRKMSQKIRTLCHQNEFCRGNISVLSENRILLFYHPNSVNPAKQRPERDIIHMTGKRPINV